MDKHHWSFLPLCRKGKRKDNLLGFQGPWRSRSKSAELTFAELGIFANHPCGCTDQSWCLVGLHIPNSSLCCQPLLLSFYPATWPYLCVPNIIASKHRGAAGSNLQPESGGKLKTLSSDSPMKHRSRGALQPHTQMLFTVSCREKG